MISHTEKGIRDGFPLEKSCLRWLSKNRSIKDIARLEAKNPREIEECLASAMASLEGKTIDDPVRKAGISADD